jgi:hypothetical protein
MSASERQPGGEAFDDDGQALAVGLACGEEAEVVI